MENKTGVVIGRAINGISINGLEYALDDAGNYIHFNSIEEAKQFLRDNGVEDEEDLEDCFVLKHHTYCLNCGKEYMLDTSEIFTDELGMGYYCTECNHSFDVN